jgi:uncharacterized protein GlcG (DUF336 family)
MQALEEIKLKTVLNLRKKGNFMRRQWILLAALACVMGLTISTPYANAAGAAKPACKGLPTHDELRAALTAARNESNGGFNLDMWATVVDRDGVVCGVVFTGKDRGDQWPGSRIISAQKANTANAFSLPKLSLSTANIYSAVQPGGSLYGLQFSNPINFDVTYRGEPVFYGQANDPMIGGHVGGVNVFGGGLALYDSRHVLVGAIGVSGDSSCADHNIAWRTRHGLKLDYVPAGVSGDNARPDNIVYDISGTDSMSLVSKSGWGHPTCSDAATKIAAQLPAVSQ